LWQSGRMRPDGHLTAFATVSSMPSGDVKSSYSDRVTVACARSFAHVDGARIRTVTECSMRLVWRSVARVRSLKALSRYNASSAAAQSAQCERGWCRAEPVPSPANEQRPRPILRTGDWTRRLAGCVRIVGLFPSKREKWCGSKHQDVARETRAIEADTAAQNWPAVIAPRAHRIAPMGRPHRRRRSATV